MVWWYKAHQAQGKHILLPNIIAHYFALGKRVLVTSMKESALTVLRDKLPEEIRPLAISLLSNEQEGMKQFEYAIDRISSEIQVINKNAYREEIIHLEQKIDELHGKLASIDRKVTEWAKKNLNPIILDKESIMPVDAANEVIKGQGQYEWLEDKLTPENSSLFTDTDIARLREARREAATYMHYLGIPLPEISSFPDSRELIVMHNDLSRHMELEAAIHSGDLPPLINSNNETIEDVCILLDKIKTLFSLTQKMQLGEHWYNNARNLLKQSSDVLPAMIEIFDALGADLNAAIIERNSFLKRPVTIFKDVELDEEIVLAIQNKTVGKTPFGLSGLIGKRAAKKKLAEIRILTSIPDTQEDWKHVESYVALQKRFRELLTRWNSIASELAIECFETVEPVNTLKAAEYYSVHITIREHLGFVA